MEQDIIPLEKLITRLRTDLKLADNYVATYVNDKYLGPGPAIQRKNQRKASMLHYLEELKQLREEVGKLRKIASKNDVNRRIDCTMKY